MAGIRAYYRLTKPGIIWANVMTALAGFLFGSQWQINAAALIAMLAGTSLVIAAACIFNNYIDRGIDSKMARTKNRSLVTGEIKGRTALTLATIFVIVGFLLLILWTNWLTVLAGFIGLVDYVVIYGWSKRNSVHSTLIGSVSGSMPIVAGYVAATNRLDLAVLLLFLIMTFWQMPHFYAIGMFRRKDYAAAGLPILPVSRSSRLAKLQIIFYTAAFLAAAVLLAGLNYAGDIYFVIMALVGLYWLWLEVKGLNNNHGKGDDDKAWAKGMFGYSLVVLLVFSLAISVDYFLP